jgi:hypothetical protein
MVTAVDRVGKVNHTYCGSTCMSLGPITRTMSSTSCRFSQLSR